ncbi:MAG TPA: NAD-dependent epimerase/dehydratase family protein [Candidatus Humimicrobiaceae bacterium]
MSENKNNSSKVNRINKEYITKTYRNKNVLITGGLGFIGSNIAIRLCNLGANITIVDSLIENYGGNLFNIELIKDKIKVNIADIRDESSMDYLVKNVNFIFNLAGQVSHLDSMKNPFVDLEINCRSQLSLLEACRKNNKDVKIIYAGTRQQYGKPDYLPVDEKHLVHPTDVNGINKMAGEWYHILYSNIYGIKATSLRLTNTYGPRQLLKHNRQGFFGWFIRKIIENEEIKIFGDGKQLRDLNYVDDVVDSFLTAGASENSYGNFYNLGSEPPISLIDLVEKMIEVNGGGSYKIVPFPEERKKIDIGDYYADFSKIKKELGWYPKTDLQEGLLKTFDYYKKYREHYW